MIGDWCNTITIHMPARYAQYWGIRDTRRPAYYPRHWWQRRWWWQRLALFTGIVGREHWGERRMTPCQAWSIACGIWPRRGRVLDGRTHDGLPDGWPGGER